MQKQHGRGNNVTDITQRKRNEQKLQFTQFIVNHADDAVFASNKNSQIIYVNDTACMRLGYSRDELLNMRIPDIDPKFPQDVWPEHWEQLKRGNVPAFESAHRRKNGQLIPVEIVARIVEYQGVECNCAFVRDITDRKRGEAELRDSERRAHALLEDSPVCNKIVDLDFRLRYMSAAGINRLKIPDIQPFYGQPFPPDLFPESMKKLVIEHLERAKVGQSSRVEYFMHDMEGEIVWYDTTFVPVRDNEDRVEHIIVTSVDITDRKRAEQKLDRFFTISLELLCIAGTDGYFKRINPNFTEVLGYSEQELLAQPFVEFVHPGDRQATIDVLTQLAEGEPIIQFSNRYLCKDGSIKWLEWTAKPVEGNTIVYAVARDITERRRAEQEKAQLEAELRQSQKMEAVGTLASGVAHDFNNLLTVIYGNVELAKSILPENHSAQDLLEMIERASKQSSNVTRSLLTFAHKAISTKEPVELSRLIRDSLSMLRRLLPASIEIVEQLPADQSVWGNVDATQMQQVLMNLVVNARDAMDGNGELRIGMRTESYEMPQGTQPDQNSNSDQAIWVIEDTGQGMDQDTLDRIFEPFFTTKSREHGTGLGLSVVHGIVTDHGGQIEVKSQPGQGTRFTIRFPTCEPPQESAHHLTKKQPDIRNDEQILLAEDNEYVRDVMVTALESEGYEVVIAVDGKDAMRVFHANKDSMNLAILDLDMPKESGQTCLEKIKKHRADMPVIMITGNIDLLLPRPPGEEKVPVLTKPFLMTELIDVVGRSLSHTV